MSRNIFFFNIIYKFCLYASEATCSVQSLVSVLVAVVWSGAVALGEFAGCIPKVSETYTTFVFGLVPTKSTSHNLIMG